MRRCFVGVTASAGTPKALAATRLHLAEDDHPVARRRRGRSRRRGSASCDRAPRSHRSRTTRRLSPHPVRRRCGGDRRRPGEPRPRQRSLPASSSMFTSLNVRTCTFVTKRAGRYMSQTHASASSSRKYVCPAWSVSDLQIDLVGEVEAALRLDDVAEHREHVAVLPEELELDLGLVALQVLATHAQGPRVLIAALVALLLDLRRLPDPVAQVVRASPGARRRGRRPRSGRGSASGPGRSARRRHRSSPCGR